MERLQNALRKNRKALAWHIDRAILPILFFSIGLSGILLHQQIFTCINFYSTQNVDLGSLSMAAFILLLVLGSIKLIGSMLEPYPSNSHKGNSNASSSNVGKDALKEYEIGNKLTQGYFKGAWTAASIFLPICFGLVAVSYTEQMLRLEWEKLLPLAGASIFLYLYWWAHANRYAGYSRTIWKRLREIEEKKEMHLHRKIDEVDNARSIKWRLKHIGLILLMLLLILWGLRLYLSPLV